MQISHVRIGPRPVSTLATPVVQTPQPTLSAAAAAPTVDPTLTIAGVLSRVRHANLEVTLPGRPGSYGSGVSGYTLAPYTQVHLQVVVRDGRLVPNETCVVFDPPMRNLLWIRTPTIALDAEGHLIARLSGFPDMNITHDVLGMDRVPLQLSAVGPLLNRSAAGPAVQAQAQSGAPQPVVVEEAQIALRRVSFYPGAIPLRVPGTQIEMALNNEISLFANRTGLTISGDVRLSDLRIDTTVGSIHTELDIGAARARAVIHVDTNPHTLAPTFAELRLSALQSDAMRRVCATDPANDLDFDVRDVRTSNGSLTIAMDLTLSNPPIMVRNVSFRDAAGTLNRAAMHVPGQTGSVLTLQGSHFVGDVAFDATRGASLRLQDTAVNASLNQVTLGDGDRMRVQGISVNVSGQGSIEVSQNAARFDGALTITGAIADGRIGRPQDPLHLDIAAGTNIRVQTPHFSFGPQNASLVASGTMTLGLDAGHVLLPSGQRIEVNAGSEATVDVQSLTANTEGMALQGSVALSLNGNTSGVSGDGSIRLQDLALHSDGRFTIGGVDAQASLRVSRVQAQLRDPSAAMRALRVSAPVPVTPMAPQAPITVRAPSIDTLLEGVGSADLDVSVSIPAGPLGPLTVRPGTVMRLSAHLRGERLDPRDVHITFTPPLHVGGTLELASISVLDDRHFWADLRGYAGVPGAIAAMGGWSDISAGHLANASLPSDLNGIPRMIMTIMRARGMALPPAVNLSTGEGCTWEALTTLRAPAAPAAPSQGTAAPGQGAISVNLSNVRYGLYAHPRFALGPFNRFEPSAGSTLNVSYQDGRLHAFGDFGFENAYADSYPALYVTAGRGNTHFDMVGTTTARGVNAQITLSNLSLGAHQARFQQSPGNVVSLAHPHLQGSITTTIEGGNHVRTVVSAQASGIVGAYDGATGPRPYIADHIATTMTVHHDGANVPITLRRGLFDGSIEAEIEGTSVRRIRVATTLQGVEVAVAPLPINLGGVRGALSSAVLTTSGRVSIDSQNGATFTGDLRLQAQASDLHLGTMRDALMLQAGRGTSLDVRLSSLQLGSPNPRALAISGSGRLSLRLAAGRLRLPNGISLQLTGGTTALLDASRIERSPGDTFGTLRGSLSFRARTTTRVPASGLQVAPGVRLESLGGNNEEVLVTIQSLALDPNGRLTLSDVGVEVQGHAEAVVGRVASPPPR